ncbi:Detected protein of confused Function [Hibiscus syriacus]|uniref:Detected protein of confused Function n=1 Tax=Hibiscus syriacus TaxID=106335 RepID=A0A6A3AUG3_HIBSY|nr:Detected protein of confused Function [Hibiscus syriacus]
MMKQGVRRLLVPKSKQQPHCYCQPPSSSTYMRDKFCCLSREDIIRFLLVALVLFHSPLFLRSEPLTWTIVLLKPPSSFGSIGLHQMVHKIIGEISASKLWKCDYLAAALALANLSAGQFVMGVEDNVSSRLLPDLSVNSSVQDDKRPMVVGQQG